MKMLKILFTVIFISLLFGACKYDFVYQEEVPVIDPNDTTAVQVSFSTQILPIFNNNNNCTQCHKTGGQIPDLTTANAYNSLNSTRYINSGTPTESKIYKHPNPNNPNEHPQKKYTAAQAAYVLAWIQQGAKNN